MYLADEDVNKTSTQRRGTHYRPTPGVVVMQDNGDLAVYDDDKNPRSLARPR